MNHDDFLKFIKHIQVDGAPLKLNPVQKYLLENTDIAGELKLRMLLPRQSSYVQLKKLWEKCGKKDADTNDED